LGGFQLLLFTLVQRRTLLGLTEGVQLLLGLAVAYLMVSRGLVAARPAAETDSFERDNPADCDTKR
jgi:hypothetical protein